MCSKENGTLETVGAWLLLSADCANVSIIRSPWQHDWSERLIDFKEENKERDASYKCSSTRKTDEILCINSVFLQSVLNTVHINITTVESPPIDNSKCYISFFSSYAICLLLTLVFQASLLNRLRLWALGQCYFTRSGLWSSYFLTCNYC